MKAIRQRVTVMANKGLALTAVAATLGLATLAALSNGCSDDEPPKGLPDGGFQIEASAPREGGATPDFPGCGHCINAFTPACRLKAFCQQNDIGEGKSSVALLLELEKCTCLDQCRTECELSCTGQGDVQPACLACNAQKCGALAQQCLADLNPDDPVCNDPFGTAPVDAGNDPVDAGGDADSGGG